MTTPQNLQDPEWLGQTVLLTEMAGRFEMTGPQQAGEECL